MGLFKTKWQKLEAKKDVETLFKLMRDPDGSTRTSAANTLGRVSWNLSPKEQSALADRLLEMMADGDEIDLDAARKAIGNFSFDEVKESKKEAAKIVKKMNALLTVKDDKRVLAAIEVLGKMGYDNIFDKSSMGPLMDCVERKEPDSEIHHDAITLLGKFKKAGMSEPRLLPIIVKNLKAGKYSYYLSSLLDVLLMYIDAGECKSDLWGVVHDLFKGDAPFKREYGAKLAFSLMGQGQFDESIEATLKEHLSPSVEEVESVRDAFKRALDLFYAKRAAAKDAVKKTVMAGDAGAVKEHLTTPDKAALLKKLNEMDEIIKSSKEAPPTSLIQILNGYLDDTDPKVRSTALDILSRMAKDRKVGDKATLDILMKGPSRYDQTELLVAMWRFAKGGIGDPKVIPYLNECLDKETDMAGMPALEAVSAMASIGVASESTLPIMIKKLKTRGEDALVIPRYLDALRIMAVQGVASWDSQMAIDKFTDSKVDSVKDAARAAKEPTRETVIKILERQSNAEKKVKYAPLVKEFSEKVAALKEKGNFGQIPKLEELVGHAVRLYNEPYYDAVQWQLDEAEPLIQEVEERIREYQATRTKVLDRIEHARSQAGSIKVKAKGIANQLDKIKPLVQKAADTMAKADDIHDMGSQQAWALLEAAKIIADEVEQRFSVLERIDDHVRTYDQQLGWQVERFERLGKEIKGDFADERAAIAAVKASLMEMDIEEVPERLKALSARIDALPGRYLPRIRIDRPMSVLTSGEFGNLEITVTNDGAATASAIDITVESRAKYALSEAPTIRIDSLPAGESHRGSLNLCFDEAGEIPVKCLISFTDLSGKKHDQAPVLVPCKVVRKKDDSGPKVVQVYGGEVQLGGSKTSIKDSVMTRSNVGTGVSAENSVMVGQTVDARHEENRQKYREMALNFYKDDDQIDAKERMLLDMSISTLGLTSAEAKELELEVIQNYRAAKASGKRACPSCGQPVEARWKTCPVCEKKL